MPARIYLLHGSHPSDTAVKAFEIKGLPLKFVELPISMQPAIMKPLFGGRTVPGVRFEDGEKVQGSTAIMRALDRRVSSPPLFDGPAGAAAIEEAEHWGNDVLQSVPRRLLWAGFTKYPRAMHGFQEGARSPKLPMPVVVALSKVVLPIERRLNGVDDSTIRADLAALPAQLDQVDQYIADGVLNGEQPNAADLQIAPSIRLLYTLEDVRPLVEGRPAEAFAFRWFPRLTASVPSGALPVQTAAQAATLPAA
ncbi:glutathione S-transferase family protein [Baekduia sp.]|jgi:glutathione S-transferase|uniref:glutathione S-transferase family protein n=1 Tax=Baekduia sp. TaxID=2600305 RepID=UPI002DF78C15|nr:glutathione S-transferase N-terminal domain-containing protein [Baekduia sp.]